MFLVIAPARSEHAAALAAAFAPATAAVLTCAELAAGPSALRHPQLEGSWISARGERLALAEIEGVVNLVPAVLPSLLGCYEESEREYQAAELHAWLTLLLGALDCPVITRPTPFGLGGPVRGPLGWHRLAAGCGVPVSALSLDTDAPASGPAGARVRVSVIGGRVVAGGEGPAVAHTLRLAQRAEVDHLRAWYAGVPPALIGASVVPDVRDGRVREALAAHMRG